MSLVNKEKALHGFEKAVDAVNNTADKAGKFAKEKELDKKIDHVTQTLEDGMRAVGHAIKDIFQKK